MFLSDGRRFLYLVRHRAAFKDKNVIRLGSLDTTTTQDVLIVNSSVEFSAGHLLFYREGTVYAQPFDMAAARLTGEPRPVLEGVAQNPDTGRMGISAAADAEVLVYRKGRQVRVRQQAGVVHCQGEPRLDFSATVRRATGSMRSHRDGTRVAVKRDEADGTMDIYLIDAARNVPERLISNAGDDMFPVWSRNGDRIYFTLSGQGELGSGSSLVGSGSGG